MELIHADILILPMHRCVLLLGDGLGQLQPCVEALADAVVAAHGDVAEPGDLLIGAADLLPRLDQRAVVEIQIQGVVRRDCIRRGAWYNLWIHGNANGAEGWEKSK